MQNVIPAIILVIWLLIGWKMCTDWNECCKATETSLGVESATPAAGTLDLTDEETVRRIEDICQGLPICFVEGSREPILSAGFTRYRDSLANLVGDGQKLRIIGLYNPGEENQSDFDNLGLWRADFIRQRFGEKLTADQIETGSQLTVGAAESPDKIRISIVGETAPSLPTSTLIYFAFNSTDKLNDREVEDYLDQVTTRVKDSGERIQLTGHTDDIGEVGTNMRLGRERALVIRDYLVSKGVPQGQIRIESFGESRPVASNATEFGRSKNRRVELKIIP